MEIRKSIASDLDAIVVLVERNRRQYQKYQPTFWRKAANSAETTRSFFTKLLSEPETFFLVAIEGVQLLGFLIARKFPAPPVYAPGGDTYLVDDFCVLEPHHWLTIGEALLSHASTLIHEAGAAQILVVGADRDLAKAEMLRRSDLTIASNWWTKPLR
ncbi:MAG: GNAT family N-acetyltransferase [Reyranella sp.]|nr:GNAT family N-acetyltransferase [Reyranella sp.]